MRQLLRPSFLIMLSSGLAICALLVVFWPRVPVSHAIPLDLAEGDGEIVWLYAATNTAPWERFVTAVEDSVRRINEEVPGGVWQVDKSQAFPSQTTAVPQVFISSAQSQEKLWFRWYKLTRDWTTRDWVSGLCRRRSPPLAIIGGSSSDLAINLANSLQDEVTRYGLGSAAPLLFLTTSTVDDVAELDRVEVPLHDLYPGRTFRFCFTNRQMARAVTRFLWQQDDLRPDVDPCYLTFWNDDPYSSDLNKRFVDALRLPAALGAVRDTLMLSSVAGTGGFPLDLRHLRLGNFRLASLESSSIPFSVGTYEHPNRWEALEAGKLMRVKLERHREQTRPLLIIPAASQPARRFLRAMVRAAPSEARRFVVATGDAISFNLVYRDRNFAWPIQDLPFVLVFFAHRDPVNEVSGFPIQLAARGVDTSREDNNAAGTDDLLLYRDIVDGVLVSLMMSSVETSRVIPGNADNLADCLHWLAWDPKRDQVDFFHHRSEEMLIRALFDRNGNRRSGTGEHVIALRPRLKGETVLPEARLEVWHSPQQDRDESQPWVIRLQLNTTYEGHEPDLPTF